MKILIVEDEEIQRVTLLDDLRDAGYKPQTTANPLEALQMAQTETFDVIISDLNMPEMTGIELLRRSKELNPPPRP